MGRDISGMADRWIDVSNLIQDAIEEAQGIDTVFFPAFVTGLPSDGMIRPESLSAYQLRLVQARRVGSYPYLEKVDGPENLVFVGGYSKDKDGMWKAFVDRYFEIARPGEFDETRWFGQDWYRTNYYPWGTTLEEFLLNAAARGK